MDRLKHHTNFPFEFNPKACETCAGNCCIGESGYIWVTQNEITRMAKYLNMEEEAFINEYLLKIRYRFTLIELPYKGGFGCIFFDRTQKMCSIYEVRPSQCRTFPFWEHFKDNIDEVETECPGIIRL